MATTEDKEKSGNEGDTTRTAYKVVGSKLQGQKLGRVIVEGSTQNPIRFADVGGIIMLSDEEHEDLGNSVVLRKQSDEQVERGPAAASSDQPVQTKEQQQRAQATGAPSAVPVNQAAKAKS